jgi:hypothetical protein
MRQRIREFVADLWPDVKLAGFWLFVATWALLFLAKAST